MSEAKVLRIVRAEGLANNNIIINGDMRVAQRGGSFTAVSTGDYTLDRWQWVQSGTGVIDIQQDTPIGQPFVYSLLVDVTTADTSIAASDNYAIRYHIEGNDVGDLMFGNAGASSVTVSFWHAHTVTGTYCISLRNSAVNRSYVIEYTQTSANIWEQSTVTFPGDTTGTWLTNNGIGLLVTFSVAIGSTYQTPAGSWTAGNFFASSNQVNGMSSTSNFFRISNVKLEKGSVATPFTLRPYSQELSMCQRYYEIGDHRIRFDGSTVTKLAYRQAYKSEKRTTPTITTSVVLGGISVANSDVYGIYIDYGSFTSGNGRATWTADAEL